MRYYSSKKRDLGERLTKYESLHSFSKKLYQIYSNFFGRFHFFDNIKNSLKLLKNHSSQLKSNENV